MADHNGSEGRAGQGLPCTWLPEYLCQARMYGIIGLTFKQALFIQFVCLVGNGIRLAKGMNLSRRWHKPWEKLLLVRIEQLMGGNNLLRFREKPHG